MWSSGAASKALGMVLEDVAPGRSGVYDVTIRRGDTVIAEFRGRSRSLGRPFLEEHS